MNIIKALISLILYVVCSEIIGLWIEIPDYFGIKYYSYYFFISELLLLILIIIFLRLIRGKNYKLPQVTNRKWYYIASAVGILYVPFQDFINIPYDLLFQTNNKITYDFNGISELITINSLAIIILFPIAEELFFREYLLNGLKNKYSIIFSLIFSSFLFSIMHFPYTQMYFDLDYNINQLYITFFGGLISGIIYIKSKSIGPSILMHIFWNFSAVLI